MDENTVEEVIRFVKESGESKDINEIVSDESYNIIEAEVSNEELLRQFREGDGEAGNKLFVNNEGLMNKYVNKYNNVNEWIEKDDLKGAAQMGFSKAMNKYDFEKRTKFSTFASYYIIWEILNKIYQIEGAGCLSAKDIKEIHQFRKLVSSLSVKYGKEMEEIRDDEIAFEWGKSYERVVELRKMDRVIKSRRSLDDPEENDCEIPWTEKRLESLLVKDSGIANFIREYLYQELDVEAVDYFWYHHNNFEDNQIISFEKISEIYGVDKRVVAVQCEHVKRELLMLGEEKIKSILLGDIR